MTACARDLMTAAPLTVRADAPVLEVVHLFVEAQIGGAPVVDADGAVSGAISRLDLLRAIDQVCDEDLDPGEPDQSRGVAEQLAGLLAGDVASPDPVWVAPETPVTEVAQLMRRLGVHRVLVGGEGQVAGILTAFDLLAAVR